MLEIKNLTVTRGKNKIINNLSFFASKGSFTAVLGKNGMGKSTLLSAIASLLPYEGEIYAENSLISRLSPRQRAKKLAFLPQLSPTPSITVRELAAYGRTPHLSFPYRLTREDEEKTDQALALAGVMHFANRSLDSLSGGERQRAFLAMTLAQDTPLLLLDEPTSYMDVCAEGAFFSLLRELTIREGKTVLSAMHDLSAAVRYAERILIVENGSAAFFGTVEECLAAHAIERHFGVRRHTDGNMHFFVSE